MENIHSGIRPPGLWSGAVVIAAITLAGLGLRLYTIGSESLWLDEGFSVLAAKRPLLEVVRFIYAKDLNPPLYYMILHVWIGWFGDSESAMRMLSALLGTLSIPLVYRLGLDLTDRRTAVWAAALTAVSLYHVFFGQEVRAYALFGFLSLLSMIFWIRLFVRPGFGSLAGYGVSTALVLYSHPYGMVHVAVQNALVVVLWLLGRPLRLRWPAWIGIQTLIGILFFPWMLVVILKIRHSHSGQASQLIPGIRGIFEVLNAFAGDADFIANGLGKRIWPGVFFASVMVAGLIPAGWGKRKPAGCVENDLQSESPVRRWGGGLIVSWLACSILIPFILSMMSVPMFSSRYMIAGSLPFLLLMARGINQIPWRLAGWVLGAGTLATQGYILVPYYNQVNKEQWRQVAMEVESRAQPGDLLVFHAPYCRSCVYWYYARRQDLVEKEYPSHGAPEEVNPKTIRDQLLPLLEGRDRVWLIRSNNYDSQGLMTRAFERDFVCKDEKRYCGVRTFYYELRNPPPSSTEMKTSAPPDP